MNKQQCFILVFLVFLILIINYNTIDSTLIRIFDEEIKIVDKGVVERIIDGDTIVINDSSIRLLGINCPEKNTFYYSEAKEFLEEWIFEKEVELGYDKNKYDRYQRILAYVFINGKNINLEIVENGYANFYFPNGKTKLYWDFVNAWKNCIKENKNLCEKSENICADCIILKEFDYWKDSVSFYNKCDFDCDLSNWEIKDEGRKTFVFENFVLKKKKSVKINVEKGEDNENVLFWTGEDYVWTKTGDALFLRDGEGRLVLWKNY